MDESVEEKETEDESVEEVMPDKEIPLANTQPKEKPEPILEAEPEPLPEPEQAFNDRRLFDNRNLSILLSGKE